MFDAGAPVNDAELVSDRREIREFKPFGDTHLGVLNGLERVGDVPVPGGFGVDIPEPGTFIPDLDFVFVEFFQCGSFPLRGA
jgi:hypothetical protein